MRKIVLLALFLASVALADEAPGTHINPVPSLTYTNTVWEFYMEDGAIKSLPIKVQAIQGGRAIVCFKYPKERWPFCFYRNEESGSVIVQRVMSNTEST